MGWFNHQLAMCCDIFFTQELETWKLLETIAAQLGFLVLRNQFFALATKKKIPPQKNISPDLHPDQVQMGWK